MEITEQIAMVLLVFALLGGLVWFTKKRGLASLGSRRGRGRCLELVERMQLTPHHAIHLVRVSEKVLLIATAPSTCTVLDAPTSPVLPASIQQDLLSSNR